MPDIPVFPPRPSGDSCKWMRYAGADIIPAWVADMECVCSEAINESLRRRMQHGVYGYVEPPPKLFETVIAYFYRRWGWDIKREWILPLPGLGCAIHAVCRMVGAPGDEILTPAPIYHVFRKAPAIAHRTRTDVLMNRRGDEWTLPVDELERQKTARSRLLQLCNPHNPNGKVFTADELLSFGDFCLRHNLLLCADEVHADLILDDDKKHLCIAALDDDIARRTVTLQSPSKAFNIAGLNFAVAVIPDREVRDKFRRALAGKVITHLNPFGIAAAIAAWNGDSDLWLRNVLSLLKQNRDALSAAVNNIPGMTMPHLAATYLAWLNVGAMKLPDPARHFEAKGVGMSPGADFGDADYMRLNFACSPDLLRDILRRLA